MKSNIKYNFQSISNGLIEVHIPNFKKVNPTITNFSDASFTVTVETTTAFNANIYLLPSKSVSGCTKETCHIVAQKSFEIGTNTFEINISDLLLNYQEMMRYVVISPSDPTFSNHTFKSSAELTLTVNSSRPSNILRQGKHTKNAITSFNVGTLGTACVNLLDGSLDFSHPDFVMGCGKDAFSLAHIYRGINFDTDEFFSDIHSQTGLGWKTNFHQFLAGNDKNASYIDAVGMEHFFKENNSTIYDGDGMDLSLSTLNECKQLTTADGDAMHFSPYGLLCCIDSKNDAHLFVEYENSGLSTSNNINDFSDVDSALQNKRISRITNAEYYTKFAYNNNKLSSITYNNSNETFETLNFNYDNAYLSNITKTVGGATKTVIQFKYKNGRLAEISGDDYSKLFMTYDDSGRVKTISTFGENVAPYSSFEYLEENKTKVTTETGIIMEYCMDALGDISTIYEISESGSRTQLYPEQQESNALATTITKIGNCEVQRINQMRYDSTTINFKNGENVFTMDDLKATLKNFAQNRFDFIYNNGRDKVCGVTPSNITLHTETDSVRLSNYVITYETRIADNNNNDFIKIISNETYQQDDIVTKTETYVQGTKQDTLSKQSASNYNGTIKYSFEDKVCVEYKYDNFGNLLKKTTQARQNMATEPYGETVVYTAEYENSRKCSETDENGKKTTYEYLAPYDVLRQTIDPLGITTYNYDNFKENISAINNINITNEKNKVKNITINGIDFAFSYDNQGNLISGKIKGKTFFTEKYAYTNNSITKTKTYNNGVVETTILNKYGNPEKITINGKDVNFEYALQTPSNKKISKICDGLSGRVITYNTNERFSGSFSCSDNDKFVWEKTIDAKNTNISKSYSFPNEDSRGIFYEKDITSISSKNSAIINIKYNDDINTGVLFSFSATKDDFGRISSKNHSGQGAFNNIIHISQQYTYKNKTNLITAENYKYSDPRYPQKNTERETTYTYDSAGNVTSIYASNFGNNNTYSYNDNKLSEATLISFEKDTVKNEYVYSTYTYLYEYDNFQNIKKKAIKRGYSDYKTISYEYDANNPFLLTKITEGANIIDISNVDGYPVSYKLNQNKSPYKELTWERNLIKTCKTDKGEFNTQTDTFTYDVFGKISKITHDFGGLINPSESKYFYDGDQLIAERHNGLAINYFYDDDGIIGFELKEGTNDYVTYHVIKDIFGSVTQVYDNNGLVLEITYDPFGVPTYKNVNTTVNLQDYFHFGFKGYYYFNRMELYFTGKQFYDPEIGRYLAPTEITELSLTKEGLNPYIYNGNRPLTVQDIVVRSSILQHTKPAQNITPSQFVGASIGMIGTIFGKLAYVTTLIDGIYVIKHLKNDSNEILNSIKDLFNKHGFFVTTETYHISYRLGILSGVAFGIEEFITSGNILRGLMAGALSAGISIVASEIGYLLGGLVGGPIGAILAVCISIELDLIGQNFLKDFLNQIFGMIVN